MSKDNNKKIKKEKKESFFSRFKEIWVVPRYRAFIKLGLYALFFLSLFLIYEISMLFKPNIPSLPDNKNNIVTFKNYTYVFKIHKYLGNDIETIKYTGTSTKESDTGLITYENGLTSSYVVDKRNNLIYINGDESDSLYDIVANNYFSYSYLDNITKLSSDNKYVDEYNNTIDISSLSSSSKKTYKIDFGKKYVSSEYDKIVLELEFYNIND